MKPRIWPYVATFLVGAALWTGYIMNEDYHQWQSTGQETGNMGSGIRNGVLVALGIAALAYAGSWAWLHRSSNAAEGANAQQQPSPAAMETHHSVSHTMLAQTGQKFVLEVRGMGVVVDDYTDEEIWQAIEEKANNHTTFLSQKPEDYTNSPDQRLSNLSAATGFSFKRGARNAVDQWPLPVFIWYPPKSKQTSRPAGDLAGL